MKSVWDLCYSPDGLRIIVAAGIFVYVYASEGTLQKTLKGHTELVYCLDFSHDGKRFSSGSADKNLVMLVSFAVTDFAIWSLDKPVVTKTKLPSRAMCCDWNSDGQYLAIGMQDGSISIRNQAAEEVSRLERPGSSIIWRVKWNNLRSTRFRNSSANVLAAIDWNQKLCLFNLSGKQLVYEAGEFVTEFFLVEKPTKERGLGFNPCDISWIPSEGSDLLLVSGSNRCCMVYSQDGVRLTNLAKETSWIMCCRIRPSENLIKMPC
ncbi:unnamed protein product [Protopolystoma xenopodis]|uniref:Intraflagellar transport protein 122 homolog n=1 Tax=Protopolystoma xenopodis TaxID=117903 RepID=A0A3S5B550_9PLAT|nr:unnamed protein product [Protopolystoma xenopodis]